MFVNYFGILVVVSYSSKYLVTLILLSVSDNLSGLVVLFYSTWYSSRTMVSDEPGCDEAGYLPPRRLGAFGALLYADQGALGASCSA